MGLVDDPVHAVVVPQHLTPLALCQPLLVQPQRVLDSVTERCWAAVGWVVCCIGEAEHVQSRRPQLLDERPELDGDDGVVFAEHQRHVLLQSQDHAHRRPRPHAAIPLRVLDEARTGAVASSWQPLRRGGELVVVVDHVRVQVVTEQHIRHTKHGQAQPPREFAEPLRRQRLERKAGPP